jgi:hypothetical protein
MAALYPIRLVPPPLSAKTASHRNQMPSSNSLAGGSAYSDRPPVLKGQNVLNFLLPGRADGPVRRWTHSVLVPSQNPRSYERPVTG